jgi:hypothetical protein
MSANGVSQLLGTAHNGSAVEATNAASLTQKSKALHVGLGSGKIADDLGLPGLAQPTLAQPGMRIPPLNWSIVSSSFRMQVL